MVDAVWPYRAGFITPMAAVAGAVAEQVLAAMARRRRAARAPIVNNGGDIALHLAPGERLRVGLVGDLDAPHRMRPMRHRRRRSGARHRHLAAGAAAPFRCGIADAVTVLAHGAAEADAAATIIANAVDIEDHGNPSPAGLQVLDDSDLGAIPVTIDVGPLSAAKARQALANGARRATELKDKDLIVAAYLQLQGQMLVVGGTERTTAGKAA